MRREAHAMKDGIKRERERWEEGITQKCFKVLQKREYIKESTLERDRHKRERERIRKSKEKEEEEEEEESTTTHIDTKI